MMKRLSVFAVVAASLLATPLLAGPPAKRPYCQVIKTPPREIKRIEPCRRPPIPPIVDPTPMFLVSTAERTPISTASIS